MDSAQHVAARWAWCRAVIDAEVEQTAAEAGRKTTDAFDAEAKLVALAMARFAKSDLSNEVWTGPARLAELTGLSATTVRRRREVLVNRGWLVLAGRGGSTAGGARSSNRYRLVLPDHLRSGPGPLRTGSAEIPTYLAAARDPYRSGTQVEEEQSEERGDVFLPGSGWVRTRAASA